MKHNMTFTVEQRNDKNGSKKIFKELVRLFSVQKFIKQRKTKFAVDTLDNIHGDLLKVSKNLVSIIKFVNKPKNRFYNKPYIVHSYAEVTSKLDYVLHVLDSIKNHLFDVEQDLNVTTKNIYKDCDLFVIMNLESDNIYNTLHDSTVSTKELNISKSEKSIIMDTRESIAILRTIVELFNNHPVDAQGCIRLFFDTNNDNLKWSNGSSIDQSEFVSDGSRNYLAEYLQYVLTEVETFYKDIVVEEIINMEE
ncbi:MAG: hypothetical protein ACRC92_20310 [Peptostreptococcaceae bacterium]